MENLIDDLLEYPLNAFLALERFKNNRRYREHGLLEERLHGMRVLIVELSEAYGFPFVPYVHVENIDGSFSGASNIVFRGFDVEGLPVFIITMRGKLSIITLLHEFAHILYGDDEFATQKWAINLFRRIYPRQFEKLVRRASDENDLTFVKGV
jgi:hypothetical protein